MVNLKVVGVLLGALLGLVGNGLAIRFGSQ